MMKGIISSIRGQKISGTLTVNVKQINDKETFLRLRLRKEFPNYQLSVFRGLIPSLIQTDAVKLPSEEFVETVRVKMLGTAILMFPTVDFPDDTSLESLYQRIKLYYLMGDI